MDLALFGRYFLDFALLYPSAFLCLASLWEKLRTPRRTACTVSYTHLTLPTKRIV